AICGSSTRGGGLGSDPTGWIVLLLQRLMVPKGGLEPPRVAPHAPQTCASASSATSARGSVSNRGEVYPNVRARQTVRPPAAAADRARRGFPRRAGCKPAHYLGAPIQ